MQSKKHDPEIGRSWRRMSTEYRRKQLVDATIDIISEVGLSKTTVNLVANRAGLSPAVVNLQFKSKDNMLVETFKSVRQEFKDAWVAAQIADVEKIDVAQRVYNMLAVQFLPELCTPKKLRVWFAFLGEAGSRDTYLEITHRYEEGHVRVMRDLCDELIQTGGYKNLQADKVARSLLASCDGLWLARMLRPETLPPKECDDNIRGLLFAFFPNHYDPPGQHQADVAEI